MIIVMIIMTINISIVTILSDNRRPVRPKHVAVLVIKRWETESCVELVGTDWKYARSYARTQRDGKPQD
jgi:hypothetical protein